MENNSKIIEKYTIVNNSSLTEFQKNVQNIMRKISPSPPTEDELCDKASEHAYDYLYPKVLELVKENYDLSNKKQPLTILDIGVYRGGSIKIWREIFPDAFIVGFDRDYTNLKPELIEQFNKDDKIRLIRGDQSSPSLKKIMMDNNYKFDLVIDDAEHQIIPQMASFALLKDLVKPGGIYLIEDIYPQHKYPDDFMTFFDVVDITHVKKRGDDKVFIYTNN